MQIEAKDLDVAEAARLSTKFHLGSVSVGGIQARSLGGAEGHGSLGWKLMPINVAWAVINGTLRVIVPVTLHVFFGEGDNAKDDAKVEHVAEIGVLLRLDYSMDDPQTGEQSLATFAGVSGLMHSWPYIRAEIQQLSTKIGLPPLVLPTIVSGQIKDVAGVIRHLDEQTRKEAKQMKAKGQTTPRKKKARKK